MKYDSIFNSFDILYKKYKRIIDRAITDSGIYLSQNNLLKFLATHRNISQNEIAENLQISKVAVANSLKKIEAKNWVVRETDKKDNRYNRVSITEEGLRIHEKCKEIDNRIMEEIWSSFNEEEIDQMLGFLDRLDKVMQNIESGGDNGGNKE